MTLHKDLIGADLHIPKLHAPTHLAGGTDPLGLAESEIAGLVSDLSAKAPLASPALTGTPVAPTAFVDTNTTQLATTAMVLAQAAAATPVVNGVAAVGVATRFARADHVHPTDTSRGAYSEGTWTPELNGFTIVGSAPALTGTYKRIGNLIYVHCTIAVGAGGNTSVACSGGNISGIPANGNVAMGNILSPGGGTITGATIVANAIYPLTFGSQITTLSVVSVYFAA